MDRGVPIEEILSHMRTADPPVRYLVGSPKGRLTVVRLVLRLASMRRSAARSVGCDQPSDFIDRQHVSIGVSG